MRLLCLMMLVLSACGGAAQEPPACARPSNAGSGPIAQAVDHMLAARCSEGVMPSLTRPTAPSAATGTHDVVFYTAHPDDESMCAGGTMTKLHRGSHRIAMMLMTHGEGGRLLVAGADGGLVEDRSRAPEEVARIRDEEMARAAALVALDVGYFTTADSRTDYDYTQSCEDVVWHWNRSIPGGLAGVVERMIRDIRTRKPRVLVTMDVRDDCTGSLHGHHRATGVLADVAARLAAREDVPGGEPHAIAELWTFTPKGATPDLVVAISPEDRLAMLRAHASQFDQATLDGIGSRPTEELTLVWRVGSEPVLPAMLR